MAGGSWLYDSKDCYMVRVKPIIIILSQIFVLPAFCRGFHPTVFLFAVAKCFRRCLLLVTFLMLLAIEDQRPEPYSAQKSKSFQNVLIVLSDKCKIVGPIHGVVKLQEHTASGCAVGRVHGESRNIATLRRLLCAVFRC
jgi:hypothetical protein